jgi:hypothetical protein
MAMKHAFKIWHSEAHKSASKRSTGRVLRADEIAMEHRNLETPLRVHHQSDPTFTVNVRVMNPPLQGVIVVLESELGSDAADAWIGNFLVRLNRLDPNLCLIAEPLPNA